MLDDYKRALETLDAQLYKKVRPGVSEAELRNLLDSFKYTQSHTLELIVESSAFAGDQGEVKGRQQGVFVSKDGQRVPYNSAVTFMVKRTPSGWFIDSVNMINK